MIGAWWYLVRRHDGKPLTLRETRHEAVSDRARFHDAAEYEIEPLIPSLAALATPRHKPTKDENGYIEKHEFQRVKANG